ncbi:MAG TPA: methionyl-tRNA formyltransferase, partial [Tenuifilaceae bacterium]|nr:methionyl-tRNA formyltransferase [Tenuifilaceae bacterium]
MTSPRIVYMGTPDFAVEPLKAIVDAGYNVVAVVTVPDKPVGRGQKLQSSPVKQYAEEKGLLVLQPEKLRNEDFVNQLKELNPDIAVVVAFRMLPETVWSLPKIGTFNLHASLLPQYRGAAPINWAVINGEKKTGLTTFLLDKEIDTGNIIDQLEVLIDENETAGELHDKLMLLGGSMVVKTIQKLAEGNYTPTPQKNLAVGELKAAPKIFKETCKVDWGKSYIQVHNFIRGLSPYPAAWSEMVVSVDGAWPQGWICTGSIRSDRRSRRQSGPCDTSGHRCPGNQLSAAEAFCFRLRRCGDRCDLWLGECSNFHHGSPVSGKPSNCLWRAYGGGHGAHGITGHR